MLRNLFRKAEQSKPKIERLPGFFGTHLELPMRPENGAIYNHVMQKTYQRPIEKEKVIAQDGTVATMDSEALQAVKAGYATYFQNIPDAQLAWYGQQGFIGWQICAMLSQNWLVNKACSVPADDAARNGFEMSIADAEENDDKSDELKKIAEANIKYQLNKNLVQFVRFKNIFGIRVALPIVESNDIEYYLKPFNIDGVTPGSYKGISQIDPYWMTPELNWQSAANPMDINFYEPTYWIIRGQRIHHSHLIIARGPEVPDILKPTYFYGGMPLTQMIYERVYAAERTANEAPMLALTKRTTAIHVDLAMAESSSVKFMDRINMWAYFRDNYGIKILGEEEQIEQFDTSLADLDAAIMTQYQLVAAIANMPSTKLLGTTPKGFSATGDYETDSYHEFLESEQEHYMTPLVDRHHELLIKSEIAPNNPFRVEISWRSLDVPTEKEKAEINLAKAQTGQTLINSGAIDGLDERDRLIRDPESGYSNLTEIGDISELRTPENAEAENQENEENEDKPDGEGKPDKPDDSEK